MDLSSKHIARPIGMLLVALMASCLPDPLSVDDIPALKEKIVVSSQMLPDQSVAILLTKSFGALEFTEDSDPAELLNQVAINDALVVIGGEGFYDTLALIEAGVYGSISIPLVEEGEYTLWVDSPSMGTVSATARVKTTVSFETLGAQINDTGFDTLARVSYSFEDVRGGRNYYFVSVQHISAQEPPEPQDFINPNVYIHLREDDQQSDGLPITESFNAFFRRDFIPGDTLLVQLANIDDGYYQFLKIRKDTRFNFSDFLGEPVNYPTNVEGGLGWFNLHFPDARVLIVED